MELYITLVATLDISLLMYCVTRYSLMSSIWPLCKCTWTPVRICTRTWTSTPSSPPSSPACPSWPTNSRGESASHITSNSSPYSPTRSDTSSRCPTLYTTLLRIILSTYIDIHDTMIHSTKKPRPYN